MLSREQILSAGKPKVERVDIPEWGGFVYVKELSAGERFKFEQDMSTNDEGWIARLVVHTVCNEDGVNLFNPEDVAELKTKSVVPFLKIRDVAVGLNALTKSDVDELEKKFGTGPSDDSSSA